MTWKYVEKERDNSWPTIRRFIREIGYPAETYYTIGALAVAVGKHPQTIRRWLREAVIPEPNTAYRALFDSYDRIAVFGSEGPRLWTYTQIKVIADLFYAHHLQQKEVALDRAVWGHFTLAVKRAWQEHDW